MKAKQILENSAKKNMVEWNQESFKKTYPKLYKTIIEAINEALTIPEVSRTFKEKEKTGFPRWYGCKLIGQEMYYEYNNKWVTGEELKKYIIEEVKNQP